jgi:thiol-disulfide isomerase/thioredoxin
MVTWTRFLTERYYVVNALFLASFALVRTGGVLRHTEYLETNTFLGFDREYQLYFMLALTLALKWRRAATMDQFLGDAFMISKCLVLLLCYTCEWRATLWYTAAALVTFVTCTQMEYAGPNRVTYLRTLQFEDRVEQATDPEHEYVVEFFTTWADNCVQFSSLFAHLSLRFATPSLSFVKVDIGINPRLGDKYGIDMSVRSKMLPTLMLFRGGKPVQDFRLPVVKDDDAKKVVRATMSEEVVTRFFELERRHLAAMRRDEARRTDKTETAAAEAAAAAAMPAASKKAD